MTKAKTIERKKARKVKAFEQSQATDQVLTMGLGLTSSLKLRPNYHNLKGKLNDNN